MKFIYNDGGRSKYYTAKNVGDCATRAIANATGLDYQLVYKALSKLAGKPVRDGCPKRADKKLLTMLGWHWTATMTIGSGCKVHLREDELPNGTLVVAVSGHLTCVDNGTLIDTYDCSRGEERCVYGYWSKPSGWNRKTAESQIEAFLSPEKKTEKKPRRATKPTKPTKKPTKKPKRAKRAKKRVSEAVRIRRLEKRVEKLEALLQSALDIKATPSI